MKEKNIPPCMIYIDKTGKWFHKGIEMVHKGIVNEFYRNLTTDSSGEYLIIMGNEKCFLEVEDTPFIVTRVEFCESEKQKEEKIVLYLINDTQENLDPATIGVGDENVLYCLIKNKSIEDVSAIGKNGVSFYPGLQINNNEEVQFSVQIHF